MTEGRIGASVVTNNQAVWVGTFYGNDRLDGKPEAIGGAFQVLSEQAAIAGTFGTHNVAE